MKRVKLPLVVALAAMLSACAGPDRWRDMGNPKTPPETLARQVCSNCHGLDGNSTSPNFPKLAGMPQAYIVNQLKWFRSHDRLDPEGFEYMWGLSRHLTDDQIDGLAAYFSKQNIVPDKPGDEKLVSKGKDVFEHGVPANNIPPCSTCHGAQGQGNGTFPRLAGQHADYLIKQLLVFQRTDERPKGAMMKEVAHLLKPEEIASVVAYLQGK